MVIDYSKIVGLTYDMVDMYVLAMLQKDKDNITVKNYLIEDGKISVNYTERHQYFKSDEYYYDDEVYMIDILDYISFVHLYTIEQMEERISQIGSGYII
jgi:hypothetical protein